MGQTLLFGNSGNMAVFQVKVDILLVRPGCTKILLVGISGFQFVNGHSACSMSVKLKTVKLESVIQEIISLTPNNVELGECTCRVLGIAWLNRPETFSI